MSCSGWLQSPRRARRKGLTKANSLIIVDEDEYLRTMVEGVCGERYPFLEQPPLSIDMQSCGCLTQNIRVSLSRVNPGELGSEE